MTTTTARRVLLSPAEPGPLPTDANVWRRGRWLARWLQLPRGAQPPCVAAYRLQITCAEAATIRVHLSADERFRLFVDGAAILVGPERGDSSNWRFHTVDIDLGPGDHWIAAQIWSLGAKRAYSQATAAPGFILDADGRWHDRLATGVAAWQCRLLDAFAFEDQPDGLFTGARAVVDGTRMAWGWELGAGDGFVPAEPGGYGYSARSGVGFEPPVLTPARLPPQVDERLGNGTAVLVDALGDRDGRAVADPAKDRPEERSAWQAWLDGRSPLELPAGSIRRCLIDFGTYRCVWPVLHAAGSGGQVRLRFTEALFQAGERDPFLGKDKGDRRDWQGKYLRGQGPVWRTAPGAVRIYETLDWECGRYLEIVAAAGTAPLRLERLVQRSTGYPFSDDGSFACDDPRLDQLRTLAVRTMRVGTHETYCDCPYYERLQYVGDTRLEVLVTYCMQLDDRLPRQAIDAFAVSRLANGLVHSRAPARGVQVIPPFALWWIHMLADHAQWRNDPAYVASHLPVARGVIDAWWAWRNRDGLIETPDGWNFVDWVPEWSSGMPAGADRGVSAILNWHFVWTLDLAAKLEDSLGDPETAALYRRRAAALVAALEPCWDEARGRWRDAPGSDVSSEHVQCLALLSGRLDGVRASRTTTSLLDDGDLARTTIYFTHYLFEAYRLIGRPDRFFDRLGLWHDLAERGLTTTPETPEPSRSDCHPWGAHPLYHFAAGVAGIRPDSLGFASVAIHPQPGPLRWLSAQVPHPAGSIILELERSADGRWRGRVAAPVPLRTPGGALPAGDHAVEWRLD